MRKYLYFIIVVTITALIIYSCKSSVKSNKLKVGKNGEIQNNQGVIIVGDSNNVEFQITKIITNLKIENQNQTINYIQNYSDSITYDTKFRDSVNRQLRSLKRQLSQRSTSRKEKKIIQQVKIPEEKKKLDSLNKRLEINKRVRANIEKILEQQSKKAKIDVPKKVVYANDVESFLNALGNYTRIILTQPEYDISPKENQPLKTLEYNHLEIIGQTEEPVHIYSDRLNDPVISFFNTNNLILKNLRIGHSGNIKEGSLGCEPDGDVLNFTSCQDIIMEKLFLYGCGTQGIDFYIGHNIKITNSEIYDCTNGIFDLNYVSNVLFDNCTFTNNRIINRSFFSIKNSNDISIVNSTINKNIISSNIEEVVDSSNNPITKYLFGIENSQNITLTSALIQENEIDYLAFNNQVLNTSNITYGDPNNKFRKGLFSN